MTEEKQDRPSFDKPAFVRKHLDSDDDIVTCRLNGEERAILIDLKTVLRCDADATVLKRGMYLLHSAIQSPGIRSLIGWIAEPRRVRPGRK